MRFSLLPLLVLSIRLACSIPLDSEDTLNTDLFSFGDPIDASSSDLDFKDASLISPTLDNADLFTSSPLLFADKDYDSNNDEAGISFTATEPCHVGRKRDGEVCRPLAAPLQINPEKSQVPGITPPLRLEEEGVDPCIGLLGYTISGGTFPMPEHVCCDTEFMGEQQAAEWPGTAFTMGGCDRGRFLLS